MLTASMIATAHLIGYYRAQGLTYQEIDEFFLPEGWRSYYIARHSWARRITAAYTV